MTGWEDLKAALVERSEPPQILHSDALTGAKTVYYKLDLKVPTKSARYADLVHSDVHQFFQDRRDGSFVAVRRTLSHTDPETGERYQMFSISKPTRRNMSYVRENELNQKYRVVPKSRPELWWLNEEAKIPPFEQKTVHLLSGALLLIWKYLKTLSQHALNIVRKTTDDGTRLVGVNVAAESLNDIRRHFGLRSEIPTTAAEIFRVDDFENNTVNLTGDIKIRTTRFQGQLLTEVCPSTFEQIRELRGLGLVNIIQRGKQRFFLPERSSHISLEPILALYPPESTEISFLPELQGDFNAFVKEKPVELPGWLFDPDENAVRDLSVVRKSPGVNTLWA